MHLSTVPGLYDIKEDAALCESYNEIVYSSSTYIENNMNCRVTVFITRDINLLHLSRHNEYTCCYEPIKTPGTIIKYYFIQTKMKISGLFLLLSAVAVGLAQQNEETFQTREIQRQLDQLANETVPGIADESIQKLEKSLNALYDKVETIIKPMKTKQERMMANNDELLEKVERLVAAKPQTKLCRPIPTECTQLINETVTDIVDKSMDALFEKVKTLIQATHRQGVSSGHPATSCKEILEQNKDSPSDYYWLRASNGNTVKVYCDMTKTCGGVTGGWMRVAQLDTTTNPQYCPYPLSRNTQYGKNLCARGETAAGCSEVNYQTNGVAYNEVCGKVISYQWGSTDGPTNFFGADFNGAYIDGVSLTNGSPRQHIWSFLALHGVEGTECRCRGVSLPSFVGNDYFCDTGDMNTAWQYVFYNNPLWDGTGCGSDSECCTFRNPPWFYKKLRASTGNNIDMRVCRDQVVTDEDVLIEKVDIFVR